MKEAHEKKDMFSTRTLFLPLSQHQDTISMESLAWEMCDNKSYLLHFILHICLRTSAKHSQMAHESQVQSY